MTVNTASARQIAFLLKLQGERATAVTFTETEIARLTSGQASRAIDNALRSPRKTNGAPAAELETGIYLVGETIYKVYKGQSGRMLAKELVPVGDTAVFEYRGMASRFAAKGVKMNLEQAKHYGAIYGVCCNCGATLTDETSIERQIGPVCAKRFA